MRHIRGFTRAALEAVLLVLFVQIGGAGAEAATSPRAVEEQSATGTSIDLPTVLRLAGAQNLEIQIARQRLEEARGRSRSAMQEFFPWLSPGFAYRRHDGLTQGTDGGIVDVQKHSYSPGLVVAAQADVGAALFRSREAKRLVTAAEGGLDARRADVLFAAVEGYFELSRAEADLCVAQEAVRIARDYETQLQRAFEVGLALRGEALRVRAQAQRNELAARQALVARRLAASRLAEVLRLDTQLDLELRDSELLALSLVDHGATLESLVQRALGARPELKATLAYVAASQHAKDGAVVGPLIPSLGALAFVGALGGGPRAAAGDFGGSRDYAVTVGWRIGPGGLFDSGRIDVSRARLEASRLELERLRQRITREVVEALARVRSLSEQIGTAREELAAAQEALRLSQERKEFGVAAVLEQILAEQDLTRARNDYINAVAEYDIAQYALLRALGGMPSGPSQ